MAAREEYARVLRDSSTPLRWGKRDLDDEDDDANDVDKRSPLRWGKRQQAMCVAEIMLHYYTSL